MYLQFILKNILLSILGVQRSFPDFPFLQMPAAWQANPMYPQIRRKPAVFSLGLQRGRRGGRGTSEQQQQRRRRTATALHCKADRKRVHQHRSRLVLAPPIQLNEDEGGQKSNLHGAEKCYCN